MLWDSCSFTQVDRLFEWVKTPKYIGWKFYPRPKGRGYSPDLQVGDYLSLLVLWIDRKSKSDF